MPSGSMPNLVAAAEQHAGSASRDEAPVGERFGDVGGVGVAEGSVEVIVGGTALGAGHS